MESKERLEVPFGGKDVSSSMYGLSYVSPLWEPRANTQGFIVKDLTKVYTVPPATYTHSQLMNQMQYSPELNALLYHSNGKILTFNLTTEQVSDFCEGSAQTMACQYGYFVFAENDITIIKLSTKISHTCSPPISCVNSLYLVKEENKLFVIATYNGGTFNVIEVIEKEDQDFTLNLQSYSFSEFNYNIISRGDGIYSDLYATGRDGQGSILILKASKGLSSGFSTHVDYKISVRSSSITTKWLPNSSQILTGTESGLFILSDYEQKKELWVLPPNLSPETPLSSGRIIKCGHPHIPLTAISYPEDAVRLLYLDENLLEHLAFKTHSREDINGMEFVRNKLYVMVGSYLYKFSVDNRNYLAASWPASYKILTEGHVLTIQETTLILKLSSIPPELIQLVIKRILLQWPLNLL
eukprot:TRINITY_DN20147_c0_g1_i1.p1 TRINITY_DN20147_c0_g1~~TRINITY_DN20147_c0_g1_i1.p1  ORF type:complete len:412 (-),score=99.19 TRINITY_DN20147_c0_g1_i1:29-1264(-)